MAAFELSFFFFFQILEAVDQPNCQRLDRPDLCPRDYYELMKKCWEDDSKDRPTFSEIFMKHPQVIQFVIKVSSNFGKLFHDLNPNSSIFIIFIKLLV